MYINLLIHAAKIRIISLSTKLFPIFLRIINHLPFAQPRPRRINTRTSCVEQSQFYCVNNREQPL